MRCVAARTRCRCSRPRSSSRSAWSRISTELKPSIARSGVRRSCDTEYEKLSSSLFASCSACVRSATRCSSVAFSATTSSRAARCSAISACNCCVGSLQLRGAAFDLRKHLVEGVGHQADLVVARLHRAQRVVAPLGDAARHLGDAEQRPRDRALHRRRYQQAEHQRAEQHHRDDAGVAERALRAAQVLPHEHGADAFAVVPDALEQQQVVVDRPRGHRPARPENAHPGSSLRW